MRYVKFLIFASLAVGMGCAAMKIGGGQSPESHQAGIAPLPVADVETVNQEAVLALLAKLETEIAGLKAGRDITGLAYNSEFGVGVAVTLCLWALLDWAEDMFAAWCLHRQKMANK